jgi:hypothetical protein
MGDKRPLTPTATAIQQFTEAADRDWFVAHPAEIFHLREPVVGEFERDRLRGRGAPIVFCIAARDDDGTIRHITKLLRFRLPSRTAA